MIKGGSGRAAATFALEASHHAPRHAFDGTFQPAGASMRLRC